MNNDKTKTNQPNVDVEPDFIRSADGQHLPKVLDPVVTMAVVQRYVESERIKSRRTMLWLSSTFLFVAVVLLLLFISVSIFVLRNSRKATSVVNDFKDQTTAYATEVFEISNKVSFLEDKNVQINNTVKNREQDLVEKDKILKSDLKRFSQWVMSQKSKDDGVLEDMQERLQEMQKDSEDREKELYALKIKYAKLLSSSPASDRPDGDALEQSMPVSETPKEHDEVFLSSEQGIVPAKDWGEVESDMEIKPPDSMEVSVVVFPNKDRYEGEFRNGFMNGWGTYYYKNGDRYEGMYRNDIKEGKGIFSYKNGDVYSGEFKEDMKSGKGKYMYRNGDKFIGEFENGMLNGKGTMAYAKGSKYSGDFRKGLRHGNGILYFANGDIYEGEFEDDQRNGKGKYGFVDGSKYIGEFNQGRRDGKGRYIYASGEEYQGKFNDGKKHGVGVCIYPDGRRLKVQWDNDKFIKVLD